MVQCIMCTSKRIGGLEQERVPPLLLCRCNSSHDHHKSSQNNAIFGNEHFTFNKMADHHTTTPQRRQKLPYQVNGHDGGVVLSVPHAHLNYPASNWWRSLKDMAYRRKPPTLETLLEETEECSYRCPCEHIGHGCWCTRPPNSKLMVGIPSTCSSSTCGTAIDLCVNQIWISPVWRVTLGTRQIISGFWIFMLGLLDISSGGIYNYLLQSQSQCNHTALILHRLTPCILLP
jgi:hypothetical protein